MYTLKQGLAIRILNIFLLCIRAINGFKVLRTRILQVRKLTNVRTGYNT